MSTLATCDRHVYDGVTVAWLSPMVARCPLCRAIDDADKTYGDIADIERDR